MPINHLCLIFGAELSLFCLLFSYSFDPLPGVEDCGQRTENEESLYAPRIAGIIIILESLDYCKILNSQQLGMSLW